MLKIIKSALSMMLLLACQLSLAAVPAEVVNGLKEIFSDAKRTGQFVELVPDSLWAWTYKTGDSESFSSIPVVRYQGQLYYINDRASKVWVNLSTNAKSTEPEKFVQENLFVWMRDYAPIINIGKVNENTPIVYSAVECPACVELESELAKKKKGYRVLPSSLSRYPSDDYLSITCAADKSKSWLRAMTKRQIEDPVPSDCDDPFGVVKAWARVWSVNSFPTAIAQGRLFVVGIPKIVGLY